MKRFKTPSLLLMINRKLAKAIAIASVSLLPFSTFAQKNISTIEKKDPSFSQLIAENSPIEQVATGFGFTEGVTWVQEGPTGYLLFSDIPANVIYRWSPTEKANIYLEKTGYQEHDLWRVGMPFTNGKAKNDPNFESFNLCGSNGLALDGQGNLLIATWAGRSVVRVEKNGERTILADQYAGKKLNGPNDLVVGKDGTIYFTDTFGALLKDADDPAKGVPNNAIYMIRGNQLTAVVEDIKNVNGLALSPNQKILYANGSIDRYIRRYEVQTDGTLTNGQLFMDLRTASGSGITDGMKVDALGNLWATGPGGIWVINPQGKALGLIKLPEDVTNLVFGGADKKTLYVSAHTSIYKIPVLVAGL